MHQSKLSLSHFSIIKQYISNSQNRVFLVKCPTTDSLFVYKKIKIVNFQKQIRELQIQRSFKHRFIVGIIKHHVTESTIDLLIEYVPGGDLFECLFSLDSLNVKYALGLFYQIVIAVEFIHARGFVHRDIKPENVLLMPDFSPKLADFGFAVSSQSIRNTISGTREYMAPEIFLRQAQTSKLDIWSLGVLLFNMTQNKYPFENQDSETIRFILENKQLEFKANTPTGIKNIIYKLLVFEPERRASAREILEFAEFEIFAKKFRHLLSWNQGHKSNPRKSKSEPGIKYKSKVDSELIGKSLANLPFKNIYQTKIERTPNKKNIKSNKSEKSDKAHETSIFYAEVDACVDVNMEDSIYNKTEMTEQKRNVDFYNFQVTNKKKRNAGKKHKLQRKISESNQNLNNTLTKLKSLKKQIITNKFKMPKYKKNTNIKKTFKKYLKNFSNSKKGTKKQALKKNNKNINKIKTMTKSSFKDKDKKSCSNEKICKNKNIRKRLFTKNSPYFSNSSKMIQKHQNKLNFFLDGKIQPLFNVNLSNSDFLDFSKMNNFYIKNQNCSSFSENKLNKRVSKYSVSKNYTKILSKINNNCSSLRKKNQICKINQFKLKSKSRVSNSHSKGKFKTGKRAHKIPEKFFQKKYKYKKKYLTSLHTFSNQKTKIINSKYKSRFQSIKNNYIKKSVNEYEFPAFSYLSNKSFSNGCTKTNEKTKSRKLNFKSTRKKLHIKRNVSKNISNNKFQLKLLLKSSF